MDVGALLFSYKYKVVFHYILNICQLNDGFRQQHWPEFKLIGCSWKQQIVIFIKWKKVINSDLSPATLNMRRKQCNALGNVISDLQCSPPQTLLHISAHFC